MSWGGGYKANFLRSVIFRILQYYHNTCYLLNITFIFDRCRRSSAVVAPVNYKCDSNNLRGSFGRSKILLTEKLTNGALVTPTPGSSHHQQIMALFMHDSILRSDAKCKFFGILSKNKRAIRVNLNRISKDDVGLNINTQNRQYRKMVKACNPMTDSDIQ